MLVNIGFQVLFHSPPGVLFTFPSRYYSLSVTREYLVLGDGPPGFPQGFTCPVVLWSKVVGFHLSSTGLSPSAVPLPMGFDQITSITIDFIRNPSRRSNWFGLFPFRSPLLRKSIFLSLPSGTQMFQFPESSLLKLFIHLRMTAHYNSQVSPFGNLRIYTCLQLPVAYRSLPRPSSAPSAKASALCS